MEPSTSCTTSPEGEHGESTSVKPKGPDSRTVMMAPEKEETEDGTPRATSPIHLVDDAKAKEDQTSTTRHLV